MPYIGKAPKNSVRSRFTYQATAGQTSFSGSDSNALTLSYVDSLYMDVYQNGVLLKAGTDYTATTGTTVVLVSSASADDVVEMVVYDVFDVADTYSTSNADLRFVNVTGDTMTGDLTIGDASASDRKILFDGNAQDFHIGLDDSTDSLTIGLGSTLGTTSHMVIDANGHITKPLQSAFLVNPSSNQTNIAVNATTTIAFGTERFDQNGDFSSNTFTAPVTGRYQFNLFSFINDLNHGYSIFQVRLNTSNVTMTWIIDPRFGDANPDYYPVHFSTLVDMDANDTAHVEMVIPNYSSAQVDFDASSYFSGYLVC